MPSLQSRLVAVVLAVTKRKAPYRDVALMHERIAAERKARGPALPRGFEQRFVAGMRVVTVRGGPRRILYLHGGCYVFDVAKEHYRFCAKLAKELGATVTIPIYPLAPEHDAIAIQAKTRAVIEALGPFEVWMGDSAGGGLALSLAQQMDAPPPLVLLSPWLDIALDHPAIEAIDAHDPWLSAPGLRECGRLYARGLASNDPRVSPRHGSVERISRISMFIGTRDILLPDARKLRDLAPERIRLFEYPEMVHDFMLIRGLPEARIAWRDIAAELRAMLGG